MSNKVPFFITGANAKLKVGHTTIAMCTDLTYSVRVVHEAPHILGVFEAFTLEPMSYEVNGSFTVVRYTKGLKSFLDTGESPNDVSDYGNGIGSWGPTSGIDTVMASLGGNSFGGTSRVDQSFDPSKLHVPQMFDVEVHQKSKDGETGIFARLRNCRMTGSDFKLIKRGIAQQTFTFRACYADEDSFLAGFSGVGQTLI